MDPGIKVVHWTITDYSELSVHLSNDTGWKLGFSNFQGAYDSMLEKAKPGDTVEINVKGTLR